MDTKATLIDHSTGGGELIPVTIRADDKHIVIQYEGGMQGWSIQVRREDVLAAIECDEHG